MDFNISNEGGPWLHMARLTFTRESWIIDITWNTIIDKNWYGYD